MAKTKIADGIVAQRLPSSQYVENFADAHPPLDNHEALVEADRCYFCYDAPCIRACPTSIDIPKFIRQISTGNLAGQQKRFLTRIFWWYVRARLPHRDAL